MNNLNSLSKEQVLLACKFSIRNREQILNSKQAGCYYCLTIFDVNEITEWTDGINTALCPHCGIDSLLGDKSPYAITKNILQQLKNYWFSGGTN